MERYYDKQWKETARDLAKYYEMAKLEVIFETLESLERIIKSLGNTGTELTAEQIVQIIDARLESILKQMERGYIRDYDKEVDS